MFRFLTILATIATVFVEKAEAFAAKRFVVTGASGYLGKEIVHNILAEESLRSAQILCLVRESRVSDEVQYWMDRNNVKVMPYDMLDGGVSVSNALDCLFGDESDEKDASCCIFHVASVFSLCDDHEAMAHENVKGAEDLMHAVAKSNISTEQIRVILTSSMAGVRAGGQVPLNGKHYTHKDWNNESKLGAGWGSSYQWSKAKSEKAAWDIANEKGIKFTSLNPAFIFGPPSDSKSSASFSIETVSKWVKGESPVQSRLCVDVRDVAKAHVIASQTEKTVNERIIISREARIPSEVIAEELRKIAQELGVGEPDKIHPDVSFDGGLIKIGDQEVACADRMADLLDGFTCRPVEETMRDMAKVLLETEKSVKQEA